MTRRALGKGIADVSGVGNGSSKSVELRNHERVARAYRSQRLIEAGTLALGAANAVVDVDEVRRHADTVKRLALRGEVLLVSRASGVPNQCFIHPRTVPRVVAQPSVSIEWVHLLTYRTNSSDGRGMHDHLGLRCRDPSDRIGVA